MNGTSNEVLNKLSRRTHMLFSTLLGHTFLSCIDTPRLLLCGVFSVYFDKIRFVFDNTIDLL